MAKLSYQQRKKLPSTAFVNSKERKYPIEDAAHGRNALARVAQHGTPAEKAAVNKKVCAKYPFISGCRGKGE